MSAITLKVNGRSHTLDVDPSTPVFADAKISPIVGANLPLVARLLPATGTGNAGDSDRGVWLATANEGDITHCVVTC